MAENPLDPQRLASVRAAVEAYNRSLANGERSSRMRLALVLAPLLLVVVIGALLLNAGADPFEMWTSPLHVFLYVAALIAGIAGCWWALRKPSSKPPADSLFSAMFGFIDGFRHSKGEQPASVKRLPRELTGDFSNARFDDVIVGSYRGFAFELFEVAFRDGQNAAGFSGAGLAFEAEQPFPGVLISGQQTPKAKGLFGRLFGGAALQPVASGVPELDSTYVFLTDNPEAATRLLTGSLAAALQWLGESWPDGRALVALKGSDAFVLLPSERNMFELPAGNVDFERDVRPMMTDTVVMLETAALLRRLR